MHKAALTLALTPLLALAACGGDDTDADEAVPAGVATQYTTLADEVAERGGSTRSGDWTVSYIVEGAEAWYEPDAGETGREELREPTGKETHHIEIIPTETATGRIVPEVPVSLQVIDDQGTVVDEKQLHFLYSTFFHYANNFEIPEDGDYTLRATLGVPTFFRHGDADEEPALASGAMVEFENVDISQE